MPHSDRSRRQRLVGLWEALPTAAVSRAVGQLARVPVPRSLRRHLWRQVARGVGMDLEEAAADLGSFRNFDELFTRKLRRGAREREGTASAIVSPADGRLTRLGPVAAGDNVSIKGRPGELETWLGRDALPWRNPCLAVVYLSPRDYHRVHTPIAGAVVGLTYRPGSLLPVNPRLVGDGTVVLGRNERLTCWLETAWGTVAVTFVGALCVGAIEVTCSDLRTNRSALRRPADLDFRNTPVAIPAGAELGAFHMGSTVIVVWEGEGFDISGSRRRGEAIRVGQVLGSWREADQHER